MNIGRPKDSYGGFARKEWHTPERVEERIRRLKAYYASDAGREKRLRDSFRMHNNAGNFRSGVIGPPHNAGNGISGYYHDNLFRSLQELGTMLLYEDAGISFRMNERKGQQNPEVVIPLQDGKVYVPDILLLDDDGNIKNYVEVRQIDSTRPIPDIPKLIWHKSFREEYMPERFRDLYNSGDIEIHENRINRFLNYLDRECKK